ncbi:MAG: hypothetical protein AAF622_19880 [Cyanobacteria bacterium P01_C01_bin.147]
MEVKGAKGEMGHWTLEHRYQSSSAATLSSFFHPLLMTAIA